MKQENIPWSEKLVLICRKCGDGIEKNDSQNISDKIRERLKDQLKAEGKWGKTRVVGSTCLGLCPEKQIAVAVCESKERQLFRISPTEDYEKLCEVVGSTSSSKEG